jgi:hypothetical protein
MTCHENPGPDHQNIISTYRIYTIHCGGLLYQFRVITYVILMLQDEIGWMVILLH